MSLQEQENSQGNPSTNLQIPLSQSRTNLNPQNYAPSNQDFSNAVYQQQMADMMQQGNNMGYPGEEMMMNDSGESGGGFEFFDDFPLDALAFNNGLAAYAAYDDGDNKAQRLKEARLMEALEKQTSLLDNIAMSYKKNKEMRDKAELRKLKNRLEKLESQKMFRELEIQQSQMANDIATQNNQLIFSHLNAQAQLRANPIVLSIPGPGAASNLNPLLLHAAMRTMNKGNSNKSYSGFPPPNPYSRPMQPYPMVGGMFPGGGMPFAPPIGGPSMFNPKGGMPFGSPQGKKSVKLPPINKKMGHQSYDDRLDAKSYINKIFAKK